MKQRIVTILKKLIIALMCITTLSSAIVSVIPIAKADSLSVLGTNKALGSPILNENFTVDNWNKWEIVCWGVFLSNFCQPLIDTYESAFKSGTTGSSGAGYKALCFGSGSDASNNETIEAFCDYAIQQQKSASLRQVYVTYSHVRYSGLTSIAGQGNFLITDEQDPNVDAKVARQATISDFFFKDGSDVDTTNAKVKGSSVLSTNVLVQSWYTHTVSIDAYVPTFWIVNTNKQYVKILDFMDTWDIQVFTAIINAVRETYESDFTTAFDNYVNSNALVSLDVFGNLVMPDRKMFFPASANQNITEDKSINLVNSWVFNSYNSTYSNDNLIEGVKQEALKAIFIPYSILSGLPAFTESSLGNIGLLYYDTDSIVLSDNNVTITPGEAVKDLFDCDINQGTTQKYPLKFEIAGCDTKFSRGFWKTVTFKSRDDLVQSSLVASVLSNRNDGTSALPAMLNYIEATDGTHVDLFDSDPVIIPVQLLSKTQDGKALRYFYNYCYKAYTGKITNQSEGGTYYTSMLKSGMSILSATTFKEFKSEAKNLWAGFKSAYPQFKKVDFRDSMILDIGDNESINPDSFRLVKVYPISDVLRSVSSVLGCVDGTEFSVYSTMIYMTYLDWYGVANVTTLTSGTEGTSNFDKDIYDSSIDMLSLDPGELTDLKSEEDMETEVLNMSYLMLSPDSGRTYRKTLIYNGISDFLYEQYNRMVYGGASADYSGSASKSNSGFFAIETFDENPLTSFFLENYVDIAVWIIAICVVASIIIGLLKKRKLSWFVFSIIIVVNCVLLVPSSGELVPYTTSHIVNKMFSSKMTAWSMSEGIANAQLESNAQSSTGTFTGMTTEEAELATKLIKQLNVVYTDRSLMLKQDISQKLTQELGGVYSEIQSLQSARWILPMVMEQFTNQEDTYGSLYVKLSNVWDDASNLYWYFNPDDATNVTKKTATSSQFVPGSGSAVTKVDTIESYDSLTSYFQDFVSCDWADDTSTNVNYANYSYTLNNDLNSIVHTYAWVLPDSTRMVYSRKHTLGTNGEDYVNADSWQKYIDNITGADGSSKKLMKSNFETTRTSDDVDNNYNNGGFEQIADTYDRTDASSLKAGFSFYKHTESPFYYFFDVVKDSFNKDITAGTTAGATLGSVVGKLLGTIEEDADGNEVRSNFMYATITSDKEEESSTTGRITNSDVAYTGYVRDVLDLEYFFSNVVPYLYQMTLETGGFDGESGILGDLTITDDSDYYEGNMQSWAYRCNWAVKLMENPELSDPMTVRDNAGNKYTVNNPLLPECYPSNRPMVYSEAQMYALGLTEYDLNVVELKCLQVNEDVAKTWTMLVNYAGTSGVTKEVFFRQMATDATMIFDTEFSTGGIMNNLYSIYPQSIDLRYLSFDSIMKMLMLNVSKNSSYVYGDTMSQLIEDTDLVTALILLLVAFACAFIMPGIRVVLMALIFYLGFTAIIRALFTSPKAKAKICCGQLISNLAFMTYTIIYYASFSLMMSVTSSDEVLSINSITTNTGNPVWVLLLVLLFSILYIAAMVIQIRACIFNYKDMGFEMYAQLASAAVDRVRGAIGSFKDSISDGWGDIRDAVNGNGSGSGSGEKKQVGINGTGRKDGSTNTKIDNSTNTLTINNNGDNSDSDMQQDMLASAYESGRDDGESVVDSQATTDSINAQIEAGSSMGQEE